MKKRSSSMLPDWNPLLSSSGSSLRTVSANRCSGLAADALTRHQVAQRLGRPARLPYGPDHASERCLGEHHSRRNDQVCRQLPQRLQVVKQRLLHAAARAAGRGVPATECAAGRAGASGLGMLRHRRSRRGEAAAVVLRDGAELVACDPRGLHARPDAGELSARARRGVQLHPLGPEGHSL